MDVVGLDFKKQQEGLGNTADAVGGTSSQGSVLSTSTPATRNSQPVPPSMSETVHSDVSQMTNVPLSSDQQ